MGEHENIVVGHGRSARAGGVRWLRRIALLTQLALVGFGAYYYYRHRPFSPEFNVVLATEALAIRLLGHIIRLTSHSPADEWKALRWPWIMRTILAWFASVAMAGYPHYTIRAYQLILFSVPTHVTGWLRNVFHTGWLVWPISVIVWALWLTVALEAIRRVLLLVLGASPDLSAVIDQAGGIVSLKIVREEDLRGFTLTVWFVTINHWESSGYRR